jgi:hypothetical protein
VSIAENAPVQIMEFAAQAVAYVRSALGVELAYDSDTLPVIDHYLRNVPKEQPETVALVASTAGAYFGEVVRRHLGGRWEIDGLPTAWRVILPTGLSLMPVGVVTAVIVQSDDIPDTDTGLGVPAILRPHLESVLERMSEVTHEEYYSLCGRFDTLEHLEDVVIALIANERSKGQA